MTNEEQIKEIKLFHSHSSKRASLECRTCLLLSHIKKLEQRIDPDLDKVFEKADKLQAQNEGLYNELKRNQIRMQLMISDNTKVLELHSAKPSECKGEG